MICSFKHIFIQNLLKIEFKMNSMEEVYYKIQVRGGTVDFEQIYDPNQLYDRRGSGLVRSAKMPSGRQSFIGEHFQDFEFRLPQKDNVKYRRLFDYFQDEEPLFPPNESRGSFIDEMATYNSFLAESGVISYNYLKTLFLTQTINQKGYYQYFIKRNGQYYLQECDDMIPVDAKTNRPIWGLSIKHPWQIMLLKAWLKQMTTFEELERAESFKFLDAFGLPEYKTFNFKKQIEFMKNERISAKKKERQIEDYILNKNDVIIIAETHNDKRLREDVGLVPGVAAYRMSKSDNSNTYRLYSSLPCKWTGKYTPVENTKLNEMKVKDKAIDLQRTFLITEQEALNYFGKCYVVPEQSSFIQNYTTQDAIQYRAQADQPKWIKFECNSNQENLLAISIEVDRKSNPFAAYPEIKYFLSKKNNKEQISKSHIRNSIRESKLKQNQYVSSNCDKWQQYRIDYHHGYHHSSAFFTKLIEGQYIFYIEFNEDTNFKIRFDSIARITKPMEVNVSAEEALVIFDSTFFHVASRIGIQTSFNRKAFDETIVLSNSFDEVGFGAIVITTLAKAKHNVGMRVFPDKLKEYGLDLCPIFYESMASQNIQKSNVGERTGYIFVSSKGRPEIIVLKRIDKSIKKSLEREFPPPGSVEFFKITPNSEIKKSLSKSKSKNRSGVRRSGMKSGMKRSRKNSKLQSRSRSKPKP